LSTWRIGCPYYARVLASKFWPGPLTLILPTTNPIFKLLGGDGKSAGVRVSPEPIIMMLLHATGKPLVATSANPSGTIMNARDENRWLQEGANKGNFDWAKPARYNRKPASTIVDCTGKVPRELRPGPISKAVWNAALSRDV
jgi:L-threonylcarbamoyladenylate synthase